MVSIHDVNIFLFEMGIACMSVLGSSDFEAIHGCLGRPERLTPPCQHKQREAERARLDASSGQAQMDRIGGGGGFGATGTCDKVHLLIYQPCYQQRVLLM